MEVRELNLNRGGQERRGGLDDHRGHLGVEEGAVAAKTKKLRVSVRVRHGSWTSSLQGLVLKTPGPN